MTRMKYQTSDMEKCVEGDKGTYSDREITLTLEYLDHMSLHMHKECVCYLQPSEHV